MHILSPNTFAQSAAAHTALQALLDDAKQLACEVFADPYGNLLFRRAGTSAGTPIRVGFGEAHCTLVSACLAQLNPTHRGIEFVYMVANSGDALEFSGLAALPIKTPPPSHAFIALSADPPSAQHLHARWYQVRCHVDAHPHAQPMAQSHHAIVLAFHSMARIQALADKLAGDSHFQVCFSRLHVCQSQPHEVLVNLTVRHQDHALLAAFSQQLASCLPPTSCATQLLAAQRPEFDRGFSLSIERFCQHLALRAYPMSLAELNDVAYLASHGPTALIPLSQPSASAAQALNQLLTELSH